MNIPAILSDPAYPDLKREVLEFTGLAYYFDKDEDFAARISRRFSARRVQSCAEYREILGNPAGGRQEVENLIGELTIGETYFFRQREQFDLLRSTILPGALQRNRSTRTLRIWSAGCATGAEPYSLALLLQLELADRIEGWDISILGTDINVDFLKRAREGRFDNWAFRETPEAFKTQCFLREGRRWVLRPEFRKYVTFRHHNLVSGEPVRASDGRLFDVILCRNVIIYLAKENVRALVEQFYNSLADGGALLVGHAEPNAQIFKRFRPLLSGGAMAYLKVEEEGGPLIAPAVEAPKAPPRAARESRAPGRVAHAASPAAPVRAVESVETARALADKGEWQQAAAVCRELIREDALNAPAYFTLGLVLDHLSEGREAETAFRRAIYLDRRFALAHYHLGITLQASGKQTPARKAFENVQEILSTTPEDETLAYGDGITAAELRDLARMHLELPGDK